MITEDKFEPLETIQPELEDDHNFTTETLQRCGFWSKSSCGILLCFDDCGIEGICTDPILYHRLRTLPTLFRHSQTATVHLFPKCCPGCISLNLFCGGEALGNYEFITEIINELLVIRGQCPVSCSTVRMKCILSRQKYRRSDGQLYPHMGNCLDFSKDFVKEMEDFGQALVG